MCLLAMKNGLFRPAGTCGLIHAIILIVGGTTLNARLVREKYDGDLLVVHMEHQAAKQPGKE